jgi:hypothetical protein
MSPVKVFRELLVRGDSTSIVEARRRLSALAPTSVWARDDLIVTQVGTDATAFRYLGPRVPQAFVWLTWEHDDAEVSNIVPATAGSLSYDEYNLIAQLFADDVLHPTLDGIAKVHVDLGASDKHIDDLVSQDTAAALRTFSHAANKSTGASHPNDAERWNRFLIHAHTGRERLDPEMLHRWLSEDEGWDDDKGSSLAIQYEQGRELLRQYDEERKKP